MVLLTTLRKLTRGPQTRSAPVRGKAPQVRLTRTFIETGDERCPLAGMWSAVLESDAADEPGLPRPAMGTLLAWRALHAGLTFAC